MVKKSFFHQPTASQIARRNKIDISPLELDTALTSLKESENYILVSGILVPEEYDSHRKFIKHAPEIIARHPPSQIETQNLGQFPYQSKREQLEKLSDEIYAAWGFYPFHLDRRKRRILFTTDFESAQLYSYAHQSETEIIVKPYDDARKVAREGAVVHVEMPSRTEGNDRYKFNIMSVPVIDSPDKFVIAHNLGTNHSCPDVDFRIRYRYESLAETSQLVNLDAHVGAGYLAIIDYYWNENRNRVPLNCGQFDIPTIQALEFYKTLIGRVLIKESNNKKPRKLDRAEKNIAIFNRLKSHGYNWVFFPTKSMKSQTNVRDYDWSFS